MWGIRITNWAFKYSGSLFFLVSSSKTSFLPSFILYSTLHLFLPSSLSLSHLSVLDTHTHRILSLSVSSICSRHTHTHTQDSLSLSHLSVLDVRFLDKQQNKSGFSTLFECLGCLSVCLSVLAGKYRHVAKPSLA